MPSPIQKFQGGTWEAAFLTSSQGMQPLLARWTPV